MLIIENDQRYLFVTFLQTEMQESLPPGSGQRSNEKDFANMIFK